ncbi:MAG: hypothetical protein PHI12_14510 [Dehalococcoidales bacterium]|nr:hypothetical protein [Methanoregulaceae archaeon]MDD5511997.1 hypothetical protein [Dehalococcoidales bacterium]
MAVTIQHHRDTAANWTLADPTLAAGEIGFETDTGKFKIGDGATAWTSLAYAAIPPGDFDESAQDAIGAMIADTNTVDLTYTDATPELKADVLYQNTNSITLSEDAGGLKADLVVQNSTSVDLSIDASGLKAEVTVIDGGASA